MKKEPRVRHGCRINAYGTEDRARSRRRNNELAYEARAEGEPQRREAHYARQMTEDANGWSQRRKEETKRRQLEREPRDRHRGGRSAHGASS